MSTIKQNFRKGIKELEKGYKTLYKGTDIDDDKMKELKVAIDKISKFYG